MNDIDEKVQQIKCVQTNRCCNIELLIEKTSNLLKKKKIDLNDDVTYETIERSNRITSNLLIV